TAARTAPSAGLAGACRPDLDPGWRRPAATRPSGSGSSDAWSDDIGQREPDGSALALLPPPLAGEGWGGGLTAGAPALGGSAVPEATSRPAGRACTHTAPPPRGSRGIGPACRL